MLFSQVWGSPGALCIFWNFLIFDSHIGGIRAFWLGTYWKVHVFTKLKFWGSFYIITLWQTGLEGHHFHITWLCSTRMVNRENIALKPCLQCNENYLSPSYLWKNFGLDGHNIFIKLFSFEVPRHLYFHSKKNFFCSNSQLTVILRKNLTFGYYSRKQSLQCKEILTDM